MTQKKGNSLRKSIISFFLVTCLLALITAVSVNASTTTHSTTLTTGETVKATLVAGKTKANTKFEVTNGGPKDLKTTISVVYRTTSNSESTYSKYKTAYSTYLKFNMPKKNDFKSYKIIQALYYNALIANPSNHTISFYTTV